MATLSLHELYKYPWRVKQFLSKFKSGQEFELDGIGCINVGIIYSPLIEEWIVTGQRDKLQGPVLQGNNGSYYKFSDLKKTPEFGGKINGGNGIMNELYQIETINNQLTEIKNQTSQTYVSLVIANITYNVQTSVKVNGNKKADMAFLNINGDPIVWGSLKKGNKPEDFQQYSGMTEPNIKDHFEIQSFISTIYDKFPNGLEPNTRICRKITDIDLQLRSIYGHKFNIEPFGEDNVTFLAQGDLKLEPCDNYFTLKAEGFHLNGEILKGKYEPIQVARFCNERNQFSIAQSRFLIMPTGARRRQQYV